MENSSSVALLIIFVFSGAVTWLVGITLAKTMDILETRFKICDAIGVLVK